MSEKLLPQTVTCNRTLFSDNNEESFTKGKQYRIVILNYHEKESLQSLSEILPPQHFVLKDNQNYNHMIGSSWRRFFD